MTIVSEEIWSLLYAEFGEIISQPRSKLETVLHYSIILFEDAHSTAKIINTLNGNDPALFSSWDESRVATDRELLEAIKGKAENPDLVLLIIRNILNSAWEMLNQLDLDEGSSEEELQDFLSKIIWTQVTRFSKSLLNSDEEIPWEPHTDRVFTRLFDLAGQNSAEKKKRYKEFVGDKSSSTGHLMLVLLGKETCFTENPECYRCPLKNNCTFNQKAQPKIG